MNTETATRWLVVLVAAVMIAGTSSVLAQETTTGTITGQVVDSQGLPIPGATVTVTSSQGRKTFVTDAEGRFHAPFLTPGRHSVRAELQGFRPVTIEGIDVSLGQRIVLPNITMRTGGLTEQVEVIAEPPVVDTTSTSIGAKWTVISLLVFPRSGRSRTSCIWHQALARVVMWATPIHRFQAPQASRTST